MRNTIVEMNRPFILCMLFVIANTAMAYPQESDLLRQYRSMVREYNQDIRIASYASSIQNEKVKSAKAEFLPSLTGNADIRATAQPLHISVNAPAVGTLEFTGSHCRYGASLDLVQPVYSGGAIAAGYSKAVKEEEMARLEIERVDNNIMHEADVHYWNKVAGEEMANAAEQYRNSVYDLVTVVRDRVQEGYSDRNDLLMAEVRLNDADYRLAQAINNAEMARMAMNSFSGTPFDVKIPTDTVVIPLRFEEALDENTEKAMEARPELKMSMKELDIMKYESTISNARFLPEISVGISGMYASPGYDLREGPNPNCAVYASLRIPIFEWGKGRSTRNMGRYRELAASEQLDQVEDELRLEIESATYAYRQAIERVRLTESSLEKAAESEILALDRYIEGSVSIIEVINAQLYHQETNMNHIQSKLNAQIAKSALERAMAKNAQQ